MLVDTLGLVLRVHGDASRVGLVRQGTDLIEPVRYDGSTIKAGGLILCCASKRIIYRFPIYPGPLLSTALAVTGAAYVEAKRRRQVILRSVE